MKGIYNVVLTGLYFFNGTIRRPYGLRYKIMPLQGIQM